MPICCAETVEQIKLVFVTADVFELYIMFKGIRVCQK